LFFFDVVVDGGAVVALDSVDFPFPVDRLV
jgi:hypothetical protein